MNKFVDQLEKNVQWVVLGLAVLWLAYMGWSYVMTPPATVTVGTKTLTPGEVDPEIESSAIALLKQSMDDPTVPPVRVPPLAERFVNAMSWDGSEMPALANNWTASKPTEFELVRSTDEPGVAPENRQAVNWNAESFAELVPAPTPLRVQSGRSIVQPDPQGGLQLVNARAGAAWVTPSFEISMDQLRSAFAQARLPNQVNSTAFIDVDLYRQEKLADGQWGNEMVVPPYAYGVAFLPYPEETDPGSTGAYNGWALTNTTAILQPEFPPVSQGKEWIPPNDSAADDFDPANYTGPLAALTEAQLKAVREARQKQYQSGGSQRSANSGTGANRGGGTASRGGSSRRRSGRTQYGGGPVGGMGPGAGFMAAMQAAREAQAAAEAAGRQRAAAAGGGGQIGALGPAGAVRINRNVNTDVPVGDFKPTEWTGKSKIVVWANDMTVEPGKTYRYALSYKIKNPLFQAPTFATDPAQAEILAIGSERSDWTQPVMVSETLNFYVASGAPLGGRTSRIRFEVFAWNNGKNASETFEVAPGDLIGEKTAAGNFATGWTLVDVRPDTGDFVLVNNDGEVMIRNFQQDQADPNYRDLKQEVEAAKETRADARP